MTLDVRGYILCKGGEFFQDCADHYAFNRDAHHFAIADGVTKSFFPQLWSRILTERVVASNNVATLPIGECCDCWLETVLTQLSKSEIKWYTKNALTQKKPALSTLVSLSLDEENSIWSASAIGDSFLFFIPEGKEEDQTEWIRLSSKPEPIIFDNFPDYLSSRGLHKGKAVSISHPIISGTFYLVTDALAEWIINEGVTALNVINNEWTDQEAFEAGVKRQRESGHLHDDDSSILIIKVEDDGVVGFNYQSLAVTSLENLIKTEREKEKVLALCKESIWACLKNLVEEINQIINNNNTLSENDKKQIHQQLSGKYTIQN